MFGNVLLWQSVAPFWFGFPTVMVAQLLFVGLAILTPTLHPRLILRAHRRPDDVDSDLDHEHRLHGVGGLCLFVDKEAKNKVFWFKVPRLYEKGPADWLCWATAAVYCFFGITLYINGTLFWGPDSPFCCFTIESPTSLWAGRALGGSMLALFLLPYYSSLPYEKLSKPPFWHLTSLPLFLYAAFGPRRLRPGRQGPAALNLWYTRSRSPSPSSSSLRRCARASRATRRASSSSRVQGAPRVRVCGQRVPVKRVSLAHIHDQNSDG